MLLTRSQYSNKPMAVTVGFLQLHLPPAWSWSRTHIYKFWYTRYETSFSNISKKWQNELVSFILKTNSCLKTVEGTWKIICWQCNIILNLWLRYKTIHRRPSDRISGSYCVVPGNIHTSPMEDFSFETTPSEFPMTCHGVGRYGYFLESHIPTSLGCCIQAPTWLLLWKIHISTNLTFTVFLITRKKLEIEVRLFNSIKSCYLFSLYVKYSNFFLALHSLDQNLLVKNCLCFLLLIMLHSI